MQLLFADQSTGARSPSMVGQGRIGELIQAKPQARRALLEEAAGISGLHTAATRPNFGCAPPSRTSSASTMWSASSKRSAAHSLLNGELWEQSVLVYWLAL